MTGKVVKLEEQRQKCKAKEETRRLFKAVSRRALKIEGGFFRWDAGEKYTAETRVTIYSGVC